MNKMNLPNKLTIFRMFLILPFVLLLLGGYHEWGWFTAIFGGIMEYVDYIALAIFIIASLTDLLDGKIARKYNLVTNFGKFMDPLADKLLVCAALIALIELGRIPSWVVILIIVLAIILIVAIIFGSNITKLKKAKKYERGLKMVPLLIHL